MPTEFTNCGCGCPEGAQLVTIEENEDRSYLYDVGGEQKETVPFTKELRQWQQSFINIGGRALNTITDIRSLTKHTSGQVMICFENNGIYQYQSVFTVDDGDTVLMPDNVFEENAGRWILKARLDATTFNLWSTLKYGTALSENQTIYVDNVNGADNGDEDGTVSNPFKTIQYAIDTYVVAHGYWKGILTIKLQSDYADNVTLEGLIGNGSLIIQPDGVINRLVGDTLVTIVNNQIKISLINITCPSMTVSYSNVSFTAVTTGDGTATNSKLNIGTDSVFSLDCSYCDIDSFEAQINSTISNSKLIIRDLQAGSGVLLSDSIIASTDYTGITLGANCNHNKATVGIVTPLTEYIGFTQPNILVKGYALPSGENIIERGFVYAGTGNPTTSDTKEMDANIGNGVYNSEISKIGIGGDTTYIRSYIITASGTYYGNQILYLDPIP